MTTNKQRYNSLFLSAHLDDVVLSCALRLMKERREGKSILVATVFSHAMKLFLDFYEGRRQEDQKALNVLNIDNPLWLGFRDAPFRNLYYTSFQSIILGKSGQDRRVVEEIGRRVLSIYEQYSPETIFLPLAIGTHIDHRHTHDVWRQLPAKTNIVFYEDRPYVFLPHNLELRLTEIGAAYLSKSAEERHQFLIDFAKGLNSTTMYKNVLVSKKERYSYLLRAARILKSQPQSLDINLQPQIVSTGAIEDVALIKKAIGAYQSQMKMLYKNMDIFAQESATHARQIEPNSIYVERYWQLVR